MMTMPVAPHAGAWIETAPTREKIAAGESRPMRARGLKRFHFFFSNN